MCGIIGVFNNPSAVEQVTIALPLLRNRGRDCAGIATQDTLQQNKQGVFSAPHSDNAVGHTLHSIVGYVPQPLRGKGTLVANCEIYNWQELSKRYSLPSANDADFLLHFLDAFGTERLEELDGVYAFAYWNKEQVLLARDILGVKPLWFSEENGFSFASEKKVLKKLGCNIVQELNPRQILIYTLNSKTLTITLRPFFEYLPEHTASYDEMKKNVSLLLDKAIEKRIPRQKFGLLFSGGIDSTILAFLLKKKGYAFTCYTAVLDTEEVPPSDLIAAQEAAKILGLNLKVKKIKKEEILPYLQEAVPLIEDSNVVKVGVALTFSIACTLAKEDGCKVVFSGLGSEEIFAGYERHKLSINVNQECLSGLRKLYERDLYRDDVITMDNGLELRLPFLDRSLVEYSLKIPQRFKLVEEHSKFIIRDTALDVGIPREFAFRKKVAAQYGSRFDNALGRLARDNAVSKSAFLKTFYPEPNAKLGVLFSSGKDSTYAAYLMQLQNYELSCLITIKSKNMASYMFHTPALNIAPLQAKAMGIPIIMRETLGEKEEELLDLQQALVEAKEKYKIDGIVSGALFSTYQRDRIEQICDKLGLKVFAPLWHKPQEQEMQELLHNHFKIIFTSVAAEGLDKTWLNKVITPTEIDKLKQLHTKLGSNVAGEGGEFESLVLDSPLFQKEVIIKEAKIVEENKNTAHLVITKAVLGAKS